MELNANSYIFPANKAQREAIEHQRESLFEQQLKLEWRSIIFEGAAPPAWLIYDEPLTGTRDSFESDFSTVLPTNTSMRDYIEQHFQGQKGLIGIELGGPGIRLFQGFSEDFFGKSAGITLKDPEKDTPYNHTVIDENLESSRLPQIIDTWQEGRQIHVLVERMGSGLECLSQDPYKLFSIFSSWYERIAEGGLMFVQIPKLFVPLLPHFMETLQPFLSHGSLEVSLGTTTDREREGWYFMRINKNCGAPVLLPTLTPREVRHSYHEFSNNPEQALSLFRRGL